MLTRCPNCTTTFRVGPEQLRARHGKVRCGQCNEVFNALDSLIEEASPARQPIATVVPTPALSVAPTQVSAIPTPIAEVTDINAEPAIEIEDTAIPAQGVVASAVVAPDLTPSVVPTEPMVTPEAESDAQPASAELPIAPLDAALHELPEPMPAWRRAVWLAAIVVALTGLLGQTVFHWRTELATLWPDARPALGFLCDLADCEVGLPRKVEHLGIESSDLHPEPASSERLVLTATIRNRAPFAQTWPHLELTLTDTADKALSRRVIAPADYLPAVKPPVITSLDAGIAAGADIPLELNIATPAMSAAGYRIYVFYP